MISELPLKESDDFKGLICPYCQGNFDEIKMKGMSMICPCCGRMF